MSDETDLGPGELFDGIERARGSTSNEGGDSEPLITPKDRPRGVLSPTDREYLCGLKEYAQPQTDANRRQDIRERVRNGLEDFHLLWLFLEQKEREKIFEELGKDGTDEVIESIVSFAYLAIDKETDRLEKCIERGVLGAANIDKVFRSAGRATKVDASIDVEYNPDVEKIYRRFKNEKQLSDAEIGLLVRAGKLDAEDVQKMEGSNASFPGVFAGSHSGQSEKY